MQQTIVFPATALRSNAIRSSLMAYYMVHLPALKYLHLTQLQAGRFGSSILNLKITMQRTSTEESLTGKTNRKNAFYSLRALTCMHLMRRQVNLLNDLADLEGFPYMKD